MRILIFILALMSAFFVPFTQANIFNHEYKDTDYILATSVTVEVWRCYFRDYEIAAANKDACVDLLIPIVKTDIEKAYAGWNVSNCKFADSSVGTPTSYPFRISCNAAQPDSSNVTTAYRDVGAGYVSSSDGYRCPPPQDPTHVIGPVNKSAEVNGEPARWCLPPPPDCDAGYHSKGTSQALGANECVPKDCPPTGSSESLFSSPRIGGAGFSGGGLYCNDGCAYTVDESQISLGQYAIGVSQGMACGDKPYDDKKLADDANTDQCTTTTNGTVTVLQCPDHNQPDPEENPIDNEESKVDDTETPEKPKDTCATGDTECNLKNIETEIENSINRQIDNDNELHNKKIDADTKNAKAFLNVMESIDTAILVQTSQDEKLHAVTIGKFNELIDAVNGIETGGGGGGTGNGTGNGNIGGQDCEGTIEECAGIGNGDGVELPHETRNLEQYAQKYNNWLPNAELPPEKCITLTNGKSLCFSFQYFIVFFQAISGLIVLSSLIHSTSIIVRSV